jgi:hypothetical protein
MGVDRIDAGVEMKPMVIDSSCNLLTQAGAEDVETYREKLIANASNEDVARDLESEGLAALTFLRYGFTVRMRETPDLELSLDAETLFAEVKHFRRKAQDDIDAQNMRAAIRRGEVATIGDTVPTEDVAAWDQVANVIRKKRSQFIAGSPNILVLESGSPNAIDDAIMQTALNIIEELSGSDSTLRRFNGLLLLSHEINIGAKRNVWFCEARCAEVALPLPISSKLNEMRLWTSRLPEL